MESGIKATDSVGFNFSQQSSKTENRCYGNAISEEEAKHFKISGKHKRI